MNKVARLGRKCLYSLSHLTSPITFFFYIEISKVPTKRFIEAIMEFSMSQDIKINTSIAILCYAGSEQLMCGWNLKHITSYNHSKGNKVLRHTPNKMCIGSIC